MTRLESGAVPVKREWLALEEVVGAALTRMESRLSALDIRVDLPSDTTLVALDGVLIEQVLINLLENAAKYAPGVVEIKARVLNGQVEFVVRDHGPGVTPGQEQLIFEKFRRSSARVGAAGFGLGLSICRAIVLAHGGQIGVENCAPSGASFRFVLPIGTDKPELGALEAVEEPLPSAPPARSEGAHS
jgi:two-component system sensor histidine kinase KdpD